MYSYKKTLLFHVSTEIFVLQLRYIEKWNGKMPYVIGSGAFPFINIPIENIQEEKTEEARVKTIGWS